MWGLFFQLICWRIWPRRLLQTSRGSQAYQECVDGVLGSSGKKYSTFSATRKPQSARQAPDSTTKVLWPVGARLESSDFGPKDVMPTEKMRSVRLIPMQAR